MFAPPSTAAVALRSRHFRRRVALAPLCLLVVAAIHFARVSLVDQTQWKGGGFGMFSTIDGPNARFVRASLASNGTWHAVAVPPQLAKIENELRAAPMSSVAEELAARMLELAWYDAAAEDARLAGIVGHNRPAQWQARAAQATDASRVKFLQVDAVRVELWHMEFDASTSQLTAAPKLVAEARQP